MNTKTKRISRKMLSAVVAIAIVLSCVAISFSVFAADTPYLVKSATPVVPMYVDKGIDLADIAVEIGGATKAGDTLNWNNDTRYGVSAQVSDGKLIGIGKGHTRFAVSDGTNTQNVWVFVNAQGDNDFTLLNSDFSNANTYSLSDWIGSSAASNRANDVYTYGKYEMWSGGSQPSIVAPKYYDTNGNPTERETLKIGSPNDQSGSFVTYYKSQELKDFGDYTVEAELANVIVNGHGDATTHANTPVAASGFMMRATLSDAAWSSNYNDTTLNGAAALANNAKSLALRIRNYGGLMLSAYNGTGTVASEPRNYLYGDQANMYYTAPATAANLWVKDEETDLNPAKNPYTLTPAPQSKNTEYIHKVKIELKGTGIKYSMNGNVIFDTIASNEVKGMYTPINKAGETGHTEDATEFAKDLYWQKGVPNTYKDVAAISHSDYEKYYKENLQAEKGTFGFINSSGMITHVYTVKVTVGGIDTANMPKMVDFATAKVFEVPSNSPAIPLYVGKGINLKLLNIGIGGKSLTGDKLTWNRISGTAAKIQDGKLVGVKEGIAGFTVTDGTNSQNVWAMVNKVGDTDFSLVNLNFANGDTFNANDWITGQFELDKNTYHNQANGKGGADGYKKIGGLFDRGDYKVSTNVSASQAEAIAKIATPTVKTPTGTKAQNALYLTSTNSLYGSTAAFYKSEMMKDFLDYSITTELSVKMEGADTEHTLAAPGIFARAQVNNNAKAGEFILDGTNKSYLFRFRNYSGIIYNSVNSTNFASHRAEIDAGDMTHQWETSYLSMSPSTGYFTKGTLITKESQLYGATADKAYILYPDAKNAEVLSMRTIRIDLNDKDVKYTLDGNVIFDIASKKPLSRTSLSYDIDDTPFRVENASSDLPWTTYQKNWGTNINTVNGGTIGLSNNFGEGLYIYSLKAEAKNIMEAEYMPTYDDVEIVTSYTVPVNTRMDLSQLKAGTTWKETLTKEYEVKNGKLIVYAVPRRAFKVTTTTGENFDITVSAKGSSTDYDIETFAPEQVTVTPDTSNAGRYTAKLAKTAEISIGTLAITAGKTEQLLDATDADGLTYEFYSENMDIAKIEGRFINEVEAIKEIETLGSTINVDPGSEAIRFKTRIPAIRNCEMYAGEFTVNGSQVTLENAGVLVIPKAILGSSALKVNMDLSANANFDAATTENVLIADKVVAKNVCIEKLAVSNGKYSDAWTALKYSSAEADILKAAGANIYDVEIATVAYLQYRDGAGNIGFIYANMNSNSYNNICAQQS